MQPRRGDELWTDLVRTADSVRAPRVTVPLEGARRARGRAPVALTATMLGAALGLVLLTTSSHTAAADGGADSTLFSLTNQDRASNGVHSLVYNGTLATIGEGGSYGGCGFTVHGRSVDMIQRNYFAHPILDCGQLVFSIMQAYGVAYRSAGENIGWVSGLSGGSASADYINNQFMHSAEHRANILNANYTQLGVGSAESAPGVSWTGAGSPGYRNVWMFSEEFAQIGAAPPPPTHAPAPRPPAPSGGSSGPSSPSHPTSTRGTAPVPNPTPHPTPTPVPSALLPSNAAPPFEYQYGGLLPSSVESVLEAFLID